MTDPVDDLSRDYRPPFLSYLTNLDERGLSAAYDLGRRAMLGRLGLLELVRVHNEVYLDVVSEARTLPEARALAEAASAFLLEALAPFEMTQRGFMAGDGLGASSPGAPRCRLPQRTTTTGHFAYAATCWLTEPRSSPWKPP